MGQGRHTLRSISDPVYPIQPSRKIQLFLLFQPHTPATQSAGLSDSDAICTLPLRVLHWALDQLTWLHLQRSFSFCKSSTCYFMLSWTFIAPR